MKRINVYDVLLTAFAVVVLGLFVYCFSSSEKNEVPIEKPTKTSQVQVADSPLTPDDLLSEVNKRRSEVGAPLMQVDSRLNQSAQRKCEEMSAERHRDHANKAGVQGVSYAYESLGITGNYGENITGRRPGDTAKQVFDRWFNSKPHKDAALAREFTLTGFGICDDPYAVDDGQKFIVEHFFTTEQ